MASDCKSLPILYSAFDLCPQLFLTADSRCRFCWSVFWTAARYGGGTSSGPNSPSSLSAQLSVAADLSAIKLFISDLSLLLPKFLLNA
jgi:hypothetical protein